MRKRAEDTERWRRPRSLPGDPTVRQLLDRYRQRRVAFDDTETPALLELPERLDRHVDEHGFAVLNRHERAQLRAATGATGADDVYIHDWLGVPQLLRLLARHPAGPDWTHAERRFLRWLVRNGYVPLYAAEGVLGRSLRAPPAEAERAGALMRELCPDRHPDAIFMGIPLHVATVLPHGASFSWNADDRDWIGPRRFPGGLEQRLEPDWTVYAQVEGTDERVVAVEGVYAFGWEPDMHALAVRLGLVPPDG